MRVYFYFMKFFTLTAFSTIVCAQSEIINNTPLVIGLGKGNFEIGELLHSDNFEDDSSLLKWTVQQNFSDDIEGFVKINNGSMEVLSHTGCTIWFNKLIKGAVTITYKVFVPENRNTEFGIVPRDVNTFWMAGDPVSTSNILSSDKYNGRFRAYHSIHGYYASLGGRDNTTTRLRIYPRTHNGIKIEHVALNDKDNVEGYKILPEREQVVQLVSFNGIVQFIVDGQIVYEIGYGKKVIQTKDGKKNREVIYSENIHPVYNEGYFGFRLTHSHHYYSDFKVYRLHPVDK